ncbi:MAG: lipid-A-disaccharide synthase [Verrucomicrobiales bacterium]
MTRRVYVVAGEMSGDIHGVELMRALRGLWSEVEFRGWGGSAMAAEAGEGKVRDWTDEAVVVGVWEVLKNYGYFREKFWQTVAEIEEWQPEVLLLIDYPGFNLRLAKELKKRKLAVKVVHYVAPQVWAWNKGRVPKVAASHDLLLCLFPFEREIFEEAGLRTVCVGHPLVDELEEKRISVDREDGLVALLPGSRRREVARLFPLMVESALRLRYQVPGVRFEAAAATPALAEMMREMRAEAGLREEELRITQGGSHALMQRASCGVVASGTATLEAGYYGLPYCLVYAVAWGTYLIARQVVEIERIGLINILAQREVVKELVQGEANAYELTLQLRGLLESPQERARLSRELIEVGQLLGGPGVHERGAEAIVELCGGGSDL